MPRWRGGLFLDAQNRLLSASFDEDGDGDPEYAERWEYTDDTSMMYRDDDGDGTDDVVVFRRSDEWGRSVESWTDGDLSDEARDERTMVEYTHDGDAPRPLRRLGVFRTDRDGDGVFEFTLTRTYDADARRETFTIDEDGDDVPESIVTYDYDEQGRRIRLHQVGETTETTEITYDAAGARSSVSYVDGDPTMITQRSSSPAPLSAGVAMDERLEGGVVVSTNTRTIDALGNLIEQRNVAEDGTVQITTSTFDAATNYPVREIRTLDGVEEDRNDYSCHAGLFEEIPFWTPQP